jgi:nicotinamide-nucleotide amidase
MFIMKALVREIHNSLIKKNITISLAESCTGGLLSYLLTSVSDSSLYFKLAVIAYSNKAKENVLGIKRAILNEKGAVSSEVALKMAKAIKSLAKTDLGISITGIAGPTGGSKLKPVGLVYIAIADDAKTKAWKFKFRGSREAIRKLAAQKTLKLIKVWIA